MTHTPRNIRRIRHIRKHLTDLPLMVSSYFSLDVPKEQRLQAVRAAIMLMADENREVLQTLLCFLSDVTSSVEENQMTPMNLAVCLAPSLFHLNIMKNDNLSPRCQTCTLLSLGFYYDVVIWSLKKTKSAAYECW